MLKGGFTFNLVPVQNAKPPDKNQEEKPIVKTNNAFKRRPKKEPISDKRRTLEQIHSETLAKLEMDHETINEKEEQLEKLKEELQEIPEIERGQIIDKKTEIRNLERKIKNIKTGENELEYITNVWDLVYEKKTKPFSSDVKIQVKNPGVIHRSNEPVGQCSEPKDDKVKSVSKKKKIKAIEDLTITKIDNRAEMMDEYLARTDRNHRVNLMNEDAFISQCKDCGSENLNLNDEHSTVCEDCGLVHNTSGTQEITLGFKETQDMDSFTTFAYKRVNHFNEHILNMQGEQHTTIPDEIYETIRQEMKKERIGVTQLSEQKIRTYLKKNGLNKYYEHAYLIIDWLNGRSPPKIDEILKEELFNMFREVQEPYDRYRPKERTNFFNYRWLLRKFFELLERDEFLPYCPPLKSDEKNEKQDQIWKKICEDLKWEFIPTV